MVERDLVIVAAKVVLAAVRLTQMVSPDLQDILFTDFSHLDKKRALYGKYEDCNILRTQVEKNLSRADRSKRVFVCDWLFNSYAQYLIDFADALIQFINYCP